ncbi:HVO_0476 family zinc finger protein [Halarchaeum sp. P4]|uniref:HVO_0476 family zinc finger protein n=1 Tax=Halarchaeum sp. P4 TaxID=3421639 RepID=UPI003EBCDB99
MSEHVERAPVACPSCSPDQETVHEILTTGGGNATVRCTECGHTHKAPLEDETTVEPTVVVSQDGESFTASVAMPADERVEKGDEFILETDEVIMQVRVTAIEVGPEERVGRSDAGEIDTIWSRAVDNVTVPITVHPRDGEGDGTRSLDLQLPGDQEFTIGETYEFGDEEFEVEAVHVRDDAVANYDFQKLGHEGDTVLAKDVKRIYGIDKSSQAWSAW